VGYGLVLLAAGCWATGGLTAKWLFVGLDSAVDPVDLSAARAVLAAAILFAYLGLTSRPSLRVRGGDIPFLALFGVVGLAMVHFAYFKTISLTDVATAILLEYLAPVLVLVVSVAFLKERFTWALPAGVALSVTGCALVVGAVGGDGLAVSPEGIVWGLLAAAFFASYTIMGKYAAGRFEAWTLLAYGLLFAAVFWVVLLGGPARIVSLLADGQRLLAVVYVAVVSTIIPFGAFLRALHHIDATKASVTSTVEPVLAGVGAYFLLGEVLTLTQVLGGALVIAAILLVQLPDRRRRALPPVG
jgi:drug/metabolite transporter (DMT)-like permease